MAKNQICECCLFEKWCPTVFLNLSQSDASFRDGLGKFIYPFLFAYLFAVYYDIIGEKIAFY